MLELVGPRPLRSLSAPPTTAHRPSRHRFGRWRLAPVTTTCENRTMANRLDWIEIGARLRQARLAAGLSQEELGSAIGLERTMIVKVESGSRRLDALELARIAARLRLPIAHFLTPAPSVLSRRASLTEDIDTDADRSTYTLEAELASWLRDLRQLIHLGLLKQTKPLHYPHPVATSDDARKAATWLRTALGAGSQPLGPLIQLCERAGQLLLVADVPGEGASALDEDLAAAIVSLQSEPGRRRSTAAHELGHLIIGDEYSTDLGVHSSRDERERAVDAFAAELLVPAETVQQAVSGSKTLDDIRNSLVQVAAVYRASWSLVLRQAVHAGAVDQRQRLASRAPTRAELMDAVGWTPAPDLHDVRVPPSVASAVMAGVRRGLITPQRATEISRGQISASDVAGLSSDEQAP